MSRPSDSARLALKLGRLLLERKAEDMLLLDLRGLCSFTDFMFLLSGRSSRQVQALADHLLREGKGLKLRPLGHEGAEGGRWVLLDYGDVIVHIFLDELRRYYDLEGLWSEAPRFWWSEAGQTPPFLGEERS